MKKRTVIIAFFAILIVACILRFYNLKEQGFLFWDEGMYMNEAVFYRDAVTNIPFFISQALRDTISFSDILERIHGWPPSTPKPMHGFIISLFSYVIGMGAYTGKFVAAFFGILCIIALFVLLRMLFGNVTALCAVFLLTFSGYHVFLSRICTPETNSAFFLLMGWIFYWKSTARNLTQKRAWVFLLLCGLSLGLSITTCYRWIVVIPILWLCEMHTLFFSQEVLKKDVIKRLVILTLSFFAVLGVCEIASIPLYFRSDFAYSFGHDPGMSNSYLGQLFCCLSTQGKHGMMLWHTFYWDLFLHFHGFLITALAIFGCIALLASRSKKGILIVFPLVVLVGLLSMKTRGNMIRYCSLSVPFFCAAAAYGFTIIVQCIKRHKIILIMTIIGTSIIFVNHAIPAALPFVFEKSGYEEMKQYLVENDGAAHLSTSNAFSEFFFGRNVADQVPHSMDALQKTLTKGNYKYVVLDFCSNRIISPELKAFIESQCTPVIRIPNSIGKNMLIAVESHSFWHTRKEAFYNAINDPHAVYIDIYDAPDVLNALEVARN